jgi:hypothetical protein
MNLKDLSEDELMNLIYAGKEYSMEAIHELMRRFWKVD